MDQATSQLVDNVGNRQGLALPDGSRSPAAHVEFEERFYDLLILISSDQDTARWFAEHRHSGRLPSRSFLPSRSDDPSNQCWRQGGRHQLVVQMEYWGRRDGRRPLESPILRSDSTLGDLFEVFFGAMKR
jgi:hypothetical protein